MSTRRQGSTASAIVLAIVASAAMHLLLWPVGDNLLQRAGSSARPTGVGRAIEVALRSDPAEDAPDPEAPPPEPPQPDGRLVKLDELVHPDRRPDDTPYVSEFDHRIEHETRAPRARPNPGLRAPPPGAASADPASRSDPSPPTPADKALSLSGRAVSAAGAPVPEGRDEQALGAPRGGAAGPSANDPAPPRTAAAPSPHGVPWSEDLRRTWGNPGTMDALDPDLEEGDANVLNTRRFKYASFFNRVRDQIAEQWRPEQVYASHDPDGSRYGNKTRRTTLTISLHPDGSLYRVQLLSGSGAEFLDHEAIRAVRAAAPFSNPPAQLVDPDDGRITFSFGFIFEVGGPSRVFRYRY